jgi:hypothetical protein
VLTTSELAGRVLTTSELAGRCLRPLS